MIKVTNRSGGTATYNLPEYNIRRVFNVGETKEVDEKELESLFQLDGGATLIKNYLYVQDEEWVDNHWEAPAEYFWTEEDINDCLLKEELDLFEETLHFAPEGILDIIKEKAWRLPLTDLNKVQALREILGFDAVASAEIMKDSVKKDTITSQVRKRKRKTNDTI